MKIAVYPAGGQFAEAAYSYLAERFEGTDWHRLVTTAHNIVERLRNVRSGRDFEKVFDAYPKDSAVESLLYAVSHMTALGRYNIVFGSAVARWLITPNAKVPENLEIMDYLCRSRGPENAPDDANMLTWSTEFLRTLGTKPTSSRYHRAQRIINFGSQR